MINQCIVDNEESGTYRCGACGCHFDFDVHTEQNLEFDENKGWLVPVCPACGNGSPLQVAILKAEYTADERREAFV